MKKIISAILAASLSLSCAVMNVQAADRTAKINTALANRDEIHILYNDKMVQYVDVKPVNHQDRIMIPFRAALESMGAAVEYDETERTVTASKGDISITFALMDDTIYIDKNGEKSTITMDVPMIIVEDRVMVPIRFMSNALGMQVGWNGNTETVVIVDYDDYLSELSEIAPNFSALAQIDKSKLNKSSVTFDAALETKGVSNDFSFGINGAAEAVAAGGVTNANLEVSVKSGKLNVDKAKLEVITDGSKVYVKTTDILTKLAGAADSAEAKAALAAVKDDTWYSVDVEKLLKAFGMDEKAAKILLSTLAENKTPDIETALKSFLTTEGDAVYDEVVGLASALDIYEMLDKYIKITNKPDGGYIASMNITTSDFTDMICELIGLEMTTDKKAEFSKMFDVNVKAQTDGSSKEQESYVDISIKTDVLGAEMTFTLKFNENAEADSNAKVTQIPESGADITNTIFSVLN